MVKCPKCKVEIEELGYSEYSQRIMDFGVDKNDYPYYENIEDLESFLKPEWYCKECNKTLFKTGWYCKECNKTLFKTETKAIKFLKGK